MTDQHATDQHATDQDTTGQDTTPFDDVDVDSDVGRDGVAPSEDTLAADEVADLNTQFAALGATDPDEVN